MNVAILGAGSIGCLLGSQLVRSGIATATFLLRDQPHPALDHSVRVHNKHEVYEYKAKALSPQSLDSKSAQPLPFVVVTTKSHQSAAALLPWVRSGCITNSTALAFVQNGFGQHEKVLSELAKSSCNLQTCILGTTTNGCYQTQRQAGAWKSVVHAGVGQWSFGLAGSDATLSRVLSERCKQLLDTLGQLPFSQVLSQPEMQLMLLRKLATNCILNPLAAKYNVKNGGVFEMPDTRHEIHELAEELAQVFRAKFDSRFKELYQAANLITHAKSTALATADNWNSMRMDLVNHGKLGTEIQYINGTISRWGKVLGVPTPTHDKLLAYFA